MSKRENVTVSADLVLVYDSMIDSANMHVTSSVRIGPIHTIFGRGLMLWIKLARSRRGCDQGSEKPHPFRRVASERGTLYQRGI